MDDICHFIIGLGFEVTNVPEIIDLVTCLAKYMHSCFFWQSLQLKGCKLYKIEGLEYSTIDFDGEMFLLAQAEVNEPIPWSLVTFTGCQCKGLHKIPFALR